MAERRHPVLSGCWYLPHFQELGWEDPSEGWKADWRSSYDNIAAFLCPFVRLREPLGGLALASPWKSLPKCSPEPAPSIWSQMCSRKPGINDTCCPRRPAHYLRCTSESFVAFFDVKMTMRFSIPLVRVGTGRQGQVTLESLEINLHFLIHLKLVIFSQLQDLVQKGATGNFSEISCLVSVGSLRV